jgi:hypothetical protein
MFFLTVKIAVLLVVWGLVAFAGWEFVTRRTEKLDLESLPRPTGREDFLEKAA